MNKLFTAIFLAVGVVGLSACGTITDSVDDRIEQVKEIARPDLEEALRSAEAHDDVIAATCWRGLIAKLDEINERGMFSTDAKKGAFSTFQKARNTRRLVSDGFSDELKLACGALKEETRSTIFNVLNIVNPL